MAISATVREYLDKQGIKFQIQAHPHTESSMRTAEAAHVSGERVAKAVLLKDESGYVLAVVPSTHNVLIGELQQQLDRPLEAAPEIDLGVVFPDCEVGAVPAVGAAYQLETVVSEALREEPELYFEAGDHERLIKLSGTDFNRLFENARCLPCSIHKA